MKRNTTTDRKISSFLLIAALVLFQANPHISTAAFADEGDVTSATITEPQTDSTPEGESETTPPEDSSTTSVVEENDTEIPNTSDTSVASSTPTITASTSDQGITNTSTPFVSNATTTLGEVIISTTTEDLLESIATSTVPDPIYASTTEPSIDNVDHFMNATGTLPEGTTTIATGDAISLANILNIVNTNLINSTGSIVMANMIDGYTGDIDLRDNATSATSTCTLLGCNGIDSITANIDANATIDNVIAVVASSGTNEVQTASTGQIFSGDTFAGLNLVNVANTNLIDSRYFLLSLNSFNTINGDIILPSLYNFFGTSTPAPHLENITIVQDGEISNDLDVKANSGGNTTSSLYGETRTGDSLSITNLYDSLNSLLIGGNSVAFLLKVSGTWVGQLFGAPQGATFVEDGGMRILSFENGAYIMDGTLGEASIYSTSTGMISNDIDVLADSGNNIIRDTNDALIETGDSIAAANIINIANTNIIGRNWVLAIINIFGDLNGNISFGQPDMWLGEQVQANEAFIKDGTILTYTITLVNRGDSIASDTTVSSIYDSTYLELLDSSIPYTEMVPGTIVFDTESFTPAESRTITFTTRIKNTVSGTDIINTATVTSNEPDNNLTDNTDTTTITTSIPAIGGGGGNGGGTNGGNTTPPIITFPNVGGGGISSLTISVIRDTPSITITGAGTQGEERLRIKNLTNTHLENVIYDDILYSPEGEEIRRETFDLGDILPNEEITLSYDVSFSKSAPSGMYGLGSALHQRGRNDLMYPRNGEINYVSFGQGGGEVGMSSNVLQATTTSLTKISTSTPQRIVRKGSILGAFIEAPLGISVAKAEVAGAKATGNGVIAYSLIYILIFLLVALMRMYYKHIRLSSN